VRALGIETATGIASVGIVGADHDATERAQPMRGSHARTLLPLIDDVLAAAGLGLRDLDLLAVSIGPGSFTGLRIGLSVAKGLALATGLPVVGVSTLEAYARRAGPRPGLLCPVLDARKGEVYAAAFGWQAGEPVCVTAPAALAPERFAATLRPPCTLVGDGVDAYAGVWRRELGPGAELIPFAELSPSGAVVARLGIARATALGADDLAGLEPFYCRQSEAELTHDRRAGAAANRAADASMEKLTGGRW
jgi:tRNA threonylcarbamoyladenosine biosynthesis protein TsaB